MKRTAVLNVVGLTKKLLGSKSTPNLNKLLQSCSAIKTVTPAVTCSVQATYLTGTPPSSHGIVGNGWYFRELSEVLFWRQSNHLVQGEKIWQTARNRNADFTCANTFWWYAMATDADYTITPRPLYCADGRKMPDCYTFPLELRERYTSKFGTFPLFNFWGPATSIVSSEWIAKAAMALEEDFKPTLQLVYLPHLDYCLQKVGPNGALDSDLAEIDSLCGRLIDFFNSRGCRLVILSEYGITEVNRPIHPNRLLREAGLLSIKNDLGKEYLDTCSSRAFAVSDHQIAHIYIKNRVDVESVKELFSNTQGVEQVLDITGKKEFGLDHERSGELVLIASTDSWFTYYWWNDDAKAPDYARTVNIHAKPGYDPCELFLDPDIVAPKVKIGWTLAKKMLGFRYLMDVIPLDATLVKGSHGRVTDDAAAGPLLMTTEPKLLSSAEVTACQVRDVLLNHIFCD